MYLFNRITVNPQLPKRIGKLSVIANNLWWSWNTEFLRLFQRIDGDLWENSNKNPIKFLKHVSQERLEDVAKDVTFLKEYDKIVEDFEGYMNSKNTWFNKMYPEEKEDQVRQCEVSLREKELALREILIGQGFSWEDTARIPKQKIEFARIKSGYTSAFLQYELALKEMRKTRIEAPVSGFIYDLKIHPNDYAKTTEPCCYIVNTDQLNVVFYMLEQEVDKLKVGKRISVTPVAYDHQTFPATITRILPIVDENGMIKVKARLERPEDLLPGMNVIVNL